MVYTSVFVIMTLPKELLAYDFSKFRMSQYPAIRQQTLNKHLP